MAKSLGQIHHVDYSFGTAASGDRFNMDLAGSLTEQLQTLVRCGTYHKVVGLDMTLTAVGTVGGGQVTGHILYYAPTRGRCEAFRSAFQSMKSQMKIQGIDMHENKMYDFRAPINQVGDNVFSNQATLDGNVGLALNHTTADGASIFGVHNRSVQPQYTGTAGEQFPAGFDTLLGGPSSSDVDFVLNDRAMYTGNENYASTDYQKIPFTLSYTPDSTDLTISLEWRPDPALFVAVMCGQMQVVVEEINKDGGAGTLELNVSVMVSGWKSIMGDPSKKSKRKSTSKVTVKKK